MHRSSTILELGLVIVDPSRPATLHAQIYGGVRDAILDGRLAPGRRLPSTRSLAETWNVSRSTVVVAFDQLAAEGYLQGRAGSGTFVNRSIPDQLLAIRSQQSVARPKRGGNGAGAPRMSRRGRTIHDHYLNRRKAVDKPVPFRPGVPANETFPSLLWRRLTSRIWRSFDRNPEATVDTMGYAPLRRAIADHLSASRGVDCDPRQVVVVSSTQHSLMLLGQILLDSGDEVWIEDPGYLRAQMALRSVGAKLVPVSIDAEGFDLPTATKRRPSARMVYVTPSHQYPLGVTMSLPRRLALLDWARRRNAWIVEDDYIAEFRLAGRPLTSLQGLDSRGRVIYLGTFSKIFSPALRLGYIVVPPALVGPLQAARSLIDRCPSFIDQAVLAAFLSEGHFGKHVRRMRVLYAKRQEVLRQAIVRHAPSLKVDRADAGMHLVAWLRRDLRDRSASRALSQSGIVAPPLSNYSLRKRGRPGLLLGYAGWDSVEIEKGVLRMGAILDRII